MEPESEEAIDRRSGRDRRLDEHDSRILRLERRLAEMDKTVAVTEVRVQGLATTLQSRCDALDRGIQLILKSQEMIEGRIEALDGIRNKAEGGIWVVRALGISALVGGLIAFAKWVKAI